MTHALHQHTQSGVFFIHHTSSRFVCLCLISAWTQVFNLDPAAEHFEYPVGWDVRDIISLDDVTETLSFG